MNRESWDETLTWMVEEQEMPEMEPEERTLIVEYLATYYSQKRRR
ncbi:MAG: hypothetical protein QGI13_11720 [Rhodospirillales bacterium]|nr:hypothetical protein [Rhodospirillales bacterium]